MNEKFAILEKIKNTQGNINKMNIVEQNALELYNVLNLVFDSKIKFSCNEATLMKVYNCKSLVGYEDIGEWIENNVNISAQELQTSQFNKFIEEVQKRTGNDLINYLKDNLLNFDTFEQIWISRTLNKNLRLGINKTSINKLFVKYGYTPIDEFVVQLCAAVKDLNDDKFDKEIKFPCYCQIKYDGIRAIAQIKDKNIQLLSRRNKDITKQFPEIVKVLQQFVEDNMLDNITLDGEIISNTNFNDLQKSLGRKEENINQDRDLKYVLYDFNKPHLFYKERLGFLDRLTYNEKIDLAETIVADDKDDIKRYYQAKLLMNEEGIIIKNMTNKYAQIPSESRKGMWKYKPIIEGTFEVVEWLKGSGKNSNVYTRCRITDKSGKLKCVVGTGFSDKDISYIQENKENIKFIDIQYFEVSKTDNGLSLRFPRFLGFRFDKEEADLI